MRSTLFLVAFTCLIAFVVGWSKEDHEIFQIRDEIELSEGAGVTFYDLLKIKPSASQDEVQRALKKLSLQWHPDKAEQRFRAQRASTKSKDGSPKVNKSPSRREIKNAVQEAQAKYARLSVVRSILTGEGRARYDHFLRNGFPKWRSTGYYYSRYRPGLGVTLLGLWLFTGGAVHYGVLVLGYNQNRKFVERTIGKARKAAFGDESAIAGIVGIDNLGETASPGTGTATPRGEDSDEQAPEPRNRKERREMEKALAKKGKVSKGPVSQKKAAAKAAAEAPPIPKRRVMAENGKVLVVSQDGKVWIEEEDDDGNTEQFILDPNDIEKPSFQQTALYRAPVWAFKLLKKKVTGSATEAEEEEIRDLGPDATAEQIKDAVEGTNGSALSAAKKKSKKRA